MSELAEAGRTYPVPYGYKVSVSILRNPDTDTAVVLVHAPMYRRKSWRMTHSYQASAFTDAEILHDWNFVDVLNRHFSSN